MENCVYGLGRPSKAVVGVIDGDVGVIPFDGEFVVHVQERRFRVRGREEYFSKVVEVTCVGHNGRLEGLEQLVAYSSVCSYSSSTIDRVLCRAVTSPQQQQQQFSHYS